MKEINIKKNKLNKKLLGFVVMSMIVASIVTLAIFNIPFKINRNIDSDNDYQTVQESITDSRIITPGSALASEKTQTTATITVTGFTNGTTTEIATRAVLTLQDGIGPNHTFDNEDPLEDGSYTFSAIGLTAGTTYTGNVVYYDDVTPIEGAGTIDDIDVTTLEDVTITPGTADVIDITSTTANVNVTGFANGTTDENVATKAVVTITDGAEFSEDFTQSTLAENFTIEVFGLTPITDYTGTVKYYNDTTLISGVEAQVSKFTTQSQSLNYGELTIADAGMDNIEISLTGFENSSSTETAITAIRIVNSDNTEIASDSEDISIGESGDYHFLIGGLTVNTSYTMQLQSQKDTDEWTNVENYTIEAITDSASTYGSLETFELQTTRTFVVLNPYVIGGEDPEIGNLRLKSNDIAPIYSDILSDLETGVQVFDITGLTASTKYSFYLQYKLEGNVEEWVDVKDVDIEFTTLTKNVVNNPPKIKNSYVIADQDAVTVKFQIENFANIAEGETIKVHYRILNSTNNYVYINWRDSGLTSFTSFDNEFSYLGLLAGKDYKVELRLYSDTTVDPVEPKNLISNTSAEFGTQDLGKDDFQLDIPKSAFIVIETSEEITYNAVIENVNVGSDINIDNIDSVQHMSPDAEGTWTDAAGFYNVDEKISFSIVTQKSSDGKSIVDIENFVFRAGISGNYSLASGIEDGTILKSRLSAEAIAIIVGSIVGAGLIGLVIWLLFNKFKALRF